VGEKSTLIDKRAMMNFESTTLLWKDIRSREQRRCQIARGMRIARVNRRRVQFNYASCPEIDDGWLGCLHQRPTHTPPRRLSVSMRLACDCQW